MEGTLHGHQELVPRRAVMVGFETAERELNRFVH